MVYVAVQQLIGMTDTNGRKQDLIKKLNKVGWTGIVSLYFVLEVKEILMKNYYNIIPKKIRTKSLPPFGKTYSIIADVPDLNLKNIEIDIMQAFSNSTLAELVSKFQKNIGKIISVLLETSDNHNFTLLPIN